MPGIFDVLAANGILSSLFGQAQAAPPARMVDTGDDTQRMANRQQAVLSGQGSVTNPAPVPMIVQAMENGGVPVNPNASYLPPDAEREIAQSQIDPRTISAGRDPFTNTYNAAATAFQNAMEPAADGGPNKWIRAADLLGKGLMAAGSPDPAKTLAMFQESDAERNRTKVTPLADGAFSMIQRPGQQPQIVRNDQVAEYLGEQQQTKFQQALQKVILGGQVQAQTAGDKAAIKTGEEARPLLNDVNGMIDRWGQAQKIIEGQGVGAQVQGAFPGIAGAYGADQAANNKILQGLTVDETLLNTARTKGAISNQEMNLFKAPIPALTDNREKVWKPWIEARLKVLDKLKTFYEGEVARGSAAAGQPTSNQPTPAPASGGPVSISSESEWANLPSGTQYRGPDGKLRTKR